MNYIPLTLLLLFGALAVGWPVLRLWRRHRAVGIVRSDDPVQKVMVTSLMCTLAGVTAWTTLVAIIGPEPMNIWPAPQWLHFVGGGLGFSGLVIVMVAQWQMGASWRIGIDQTPTTLVTSGIFASVRHPIYTGLIALMAALVMMTPSPWTVMGAGWLISIIAIQARIEEDVLARRHGEAYRRWAAKTGRFFPWVG